MLKTRRSILWRADLEPWRWLILGSVGALASSCGGKSRENDDDVLIGNPGGTGGTALGGTGGSGGTFGHIDGDPTTYGGAGGSSPAEPSTIACAQPARDMGGGWQQCGNGLIHRANIANCPSLLPRGGYPDPVSDAGSDAGSDAPAVPNGTCRRDSDCSERAHGHCETGPGALESYCVYGCVRDSECGPGFACLCGGVVGSCVQADCKRDLDCGGALCANYTDSPGCGGLAFKCQSAQDECASDAECLGGRAYCSLEGRDGEEHRTCQSQTCVIGRPFLIEGEERLAPCVERCDWYPAQEQRARPTPNELDPELRAALLEGWTAQALMEHASVAAFARFTLQLASLGAPAELLSRTATALQDEIRHARACFALARRYSERELGPGPLPIQGALAASDWAAVLTSTIIEGCIGETVAAVEAAEALSHCADPVARAVLERIVAEETEHAQLAWQFVAWALRSGPAGLREQARTVFQAELERPAPVALVASARDESLLRHGLVSPALRPALRARVLRSVIEPCAQALLGQRPRQQDRHREPEQRQSRA